ncbi:MAG TPA: hypothetical protein VM115_13590 [Vicinamibacterales bacterium]|nr:hypothetical protein [Vicinamibacterales bacterium]
MLMVIQGQRVFAVAIIAAFLIGPCLTVCTGWSTSSHARMACCADRAHDDADACCAAGENQQQGSDPLGVFPTSALRAPAPVAFTIDAVVPVPSRFTFDIPSHTTRPSDSDRHVRLSVFLI